MEKTERLIREHGLAVIGTSVTTEHGELPMSYTIGLSDIGKSELVVFGLPAQSAMVMLKDAAALYRKDGLLLNQPVEQIGNLPVVFKPVLPAAAAEYIHQANARAGRDLPAIQMVWPDPAGLFPWDQGFAKRFIPMQPALYQVAH